MVLSLRPENYLNFHEVNISDTPAQLINKNPSVS